VAHHSSGLTLDGGSFSVLEEETFAAKASSIHPPRRKTPDLLRADLALMQARKTPPRSKPWSRVRISQGIMITESEIRRK